MARPSLESFLQREDLEEEVQIKFLRGKKGDKGEDGKDADPEEVAEMVLIPVSEILKGDEEFKESLRGERGKDGIGKNGKDAKIDIVSITERVLNILPSQTQQVLKGEDGKDGSPDTPKVIIEKINKSRGDKIKRTRIEGLDEVESIARTSQRQVQNFLSLGGTRQTAIKSVGTLIGTGITTIDFRNGTFVKIGDGSEVQYTAPTVGGGGGFQQPISGAVDGANAVFVWSVAPNAISIDQGRVMQKVSSDGTVNWTGTTTITLTNPPNFDIYGVS